jgi:hypothetical protein
VVTGQLGGQVNLTKGFSPEGMLDIGLQLMHLTPSYFEGQLEKNVPGGVKAVKGVKEAASLLSGINSNGLAPTIKSYFEKADTLKDQIFESLKTWARDTVVKKALAVLASTLIPGAGIIQAAIKIYETVTFIWEKFKLISKTLEAITGSLADIANGRIDSAITKIVSSLVGGLSLAIGFLVKISGLGGIADRIKAFFTNIRGKIDAAIKKVIDKFKAWVGGKGSSAPVASDKSNSSAKPTDAPKPDATSNVNVSDHLVTSKINIEGDVETHQVWAEIKGGQPIMMMASTPKEIIAHLQDFKADARLKLKTDSPEFKMVSDQISASGKDVGKGIAEMRNVLKITNPRASNTSNKVVTLPGSKISSDADLSKIAVNTLTSVKQHMEIAFPILNQAGITVDNLKQAVSLAGGIVQFMKDIAAGKAPGGIDHTQLKKLWSQQTGNKLQHRETLKTMFRNAMPGKHEWIPSDMMLAVIERDMDADKMGIVPEWIDLQHNFRIDTEHVVFKPSYESIQGYNGKNYSVLNGHSGAIYLVNKTLSGNTYSPRTEHQADFHNELRENFKSIDTKVDLLNKIKVTAQKWAWDGNGNPANPIHPNLVWKNNSQYVDLSNGSGLSKLKSNLSSYFTNLMKQIEDLK